MLVWDRKIYYIQTRNKMIVTLFTSRVTSSVPVFFSVVQSTVHIPFLEMSTPDPILCQLDTWTEIEAIPCTKNTCFLPSIPKKNKSTCCPIPRWDYKYNCRMQLHWVTREILIAQK
jgi:hypothetical protein